MTFFAKNIHYLRKMRNLRQEQMQTELNIERSTWSNYENKQTEPKIEVLIRIAKFFGVGLDELLMEDLAEVRFGQENKSEENSQKGKVSGKVSGKVRQENPTNYPVNIPAEGQTLTDELNPIKAANKPHLIESTNTDFATVKDYVNSIKQANTALSALNKIYETTIQQLTDQLNELKGKDHK